MVPIKTRPDSAGQGAVRMDTRHHDTLQAERFYVNPWARQTSSEIPATEAFTDSVRGTPTMEQNDSSTPVPNNMTVPPPKTSTLPTRPCSSGPGSYSELDVIGKDVKRMMDAIQRLRHLGFETSVVPLPKIVVVGDQSTGKSSVIEGISGIKVPRNVGTCTRCPLEINLANSDHPWQCKMYLSRRFMYEPHQFGGTVSKSRPFGPWVSLHSPEENEFAVLDSKEAVAKTLLLAQLATLNPGTNFQVFQPSNDSGHSGSLQVDFSPNVVRLDISGPGLPNLAFYDLPGMISHVAEEKQNAMPKLVENLVREYIKSSNTIILLTLTMNHDIQNSKAAGFIGKTKSDNNSVKPDDRTVGVFTKPDLLSPDSEDLFLRIFAGKDFKRKLGYFVVKNNHDPRVDHTTARNEEYKFFSEWPKEYPRLSQHKDRFGTTRLQEELSRLLADQIRSSLPTIRDIVQQKMTHFQTNLSQLPRPPTGNLSLEVMTNLSALSRDLEAIFKRTVGTSAFMEQFQKMTRSFRAKLVNTHPRFQATPRGSLEATSRNATTPIPSRRTAEYISIDDDDDDGNTESTSPLVNNNSLTRKRPVGSVQHGINKRTRVEQEVRSSSQAEAKSFSLQEVRDMIVSKDDTGFPGSQNSLVTKELYAQSIHHWRELTQSYLNESCGLIGESIMSRARTAFSRQINTPLWRRVEQEVKTFVFSAFQDHSEFSMRCLRMEKGVFTLDRDTIEPARKAALETMQRDRCEDRVAQQIEDEEKNGKVITDTARKQRQTHAQKGIVDNHFSDEFKMEIEQMATVRGYYHYAATRYAEYVALCLRTEVFAKCANDLCPYLSNYLHLEEEDANAQIRKLLEISPEVANERIRCEEQLRILQRGLEQLQELEQDGSSNDEPSTQSTVL